MAAQCSECDRAAVNSRGWCWAHYTRWRRYGDVSVVNVGGVKPGQDGAAHPKWTGDKVNVTGAHYRIVKARGRAAEQECAWCTAPAHDWAFQYGTPRARVLTDPKSGRPFSLDPGDYKPMCRACHKTYDLNRKKVS